jgi:hypothetical protein
MDAAAVWMQGVACDRMAPIAEPDQQGRAIRASVGDIPLASVAS